jgi:hypothetical protein
MKRSFFVILIFLLLIPLSLGHHPEHENERLDFEGGAETLDAQITASVIDAVTIASIILVLFIFISFMRSDISEKEKYILFFGIVVAVLIATFYSAGATIYLNMISETQGPVHWHADFEIWDCGAFVDLVKPTGLSNRIGTPVYHEHNDNRVHVEGVVVDYGDVDLETFFAVIGGSINADSLSVPTDDGMVTMKNNGQCDGQAAELQVFLYRIVNADATQNTGFLYEQVKLSAEEYRHYVLAPYSYVPPGDCVIIEFGPGKDKTENICETYSVAIVKGDLSEVLE